MTRIITLASQYGVWQSADLRLSDPATGKVTDDYSVKQVLLRCADGAAVLAYGGHGRFIRPCSHEQMDLSDWIREFVRGEPYSVDQTMRLIQQRATEDIGTALLDGKIRHIFNAAAMPFAPGGAPVIIQIRNFSVISEFVAGPVEREFQMVSMGVAVGSGAVGSWPQGVSAKDDMMLRQASVRRPRDPKEFSNLLATVNLRNPAATVSPHCVTTYLSPTGTFSCDRHNFPPGAPDVIVPVLVLGIDGTDVMREMIAHFTKTKSGTDLVPPWVGPESVTLTCRAIFGPVET